MPERLHAIPARPGAQIYEMIAFLLSGKSGVFVLHHVVVIMTYSLVLHCEQMHFWAALAGLVEATNPSLSILQVGLLSGFGRGSRLELANGVCLWLIYVVVRRRASRNQNSARPSGRLTGNKSSVNLTVLRPPRPR